MRKRIIGVLAVLLVLVIATTLVFYFLSGKEENNGKAEQLVAINEIDKLMLEGNTELASEKLAAF